MFKILCLFILVYLIYIGTIFLYKLFANCSTADAQLKIHSFLKEISMPPPSPEPTSTVISQADMDEIARGLSRFFDSVRYIGCQPSSAGFIVYGFTAYGANTSSKDIEKLKTIISNEVAKYLSSVLYWQYFHVFCFKIIEGDLRIAIADTPSSIKTLRSLEHKYSRMEHKKQDDITERID